MGYSSVLFGLARVYHGRRETAALGDSGRELGSHNTTVM
jgi:hypothetical protein